MAGKVPSYCNYPFPCVFACVWINFDNLDFLKLIYLKNDFFLYRLKNEFVYVRVYICEK